MEAIILMGMQASGKSSFYKKMFADTHLRINLDMLSRRSKEKIILDACIKAKQSFVVDNTNPTRSNRERYILPALKAGYKVKGYLMDSNFDACRIRNDARTGKAKIPVQGLLQFLKRFELPTYDEGFNELFCVEISLPSSFVVKRL